MGLLARVHSSMLGFFIDVHCAAEVYEKVHTSRKTCSARVSLVSSPGEYSRLQEGDPPNG